MADRFGEYSLPLVPKSDHGPSLRCGGRSGASADEAWQARTTITNQERSRFQQVLQVHRRKAAEDLGINSTAALDHFDRSR